MDNGRGILINIDRWIERESEEECMSSFELEGTKCSKCSHFMKDEDEDDRAYWHDDHVYCQDCYQELGLYPSEDINWEDPMEYEWEIDDLMWG